MTGVVVQLTYPEIMQGATVGIIRHVQNLRSGAKNAYGCRDEFGWQANLEGALGEMAFAKWSGQFWSGAHAKFARDVGNVEVRTGAQPGSSLIVHRQDADDARFYLLTGCNGRYVIRGWIVGAEAKQERWWTDRARNNRPAFFVPQSALTPAGMEW